MKDTYCDNKCKPNYFSSRAYSTRSSIIIMATRRNMTYKNKSRTSEGLIGCLLTNTCQQNRSCEDKAEGALPSLSHKSYLCWMLKKSSAFSPENDEERKSWLKCSLHSEKFIRFCYFISHKFNLKAAHSRNTSKFSQLSNANLIRFLSFFASL